jgi:hypothetical protein
MEAEQLAKYQKIAEQHFAASHISYVENSKWILASLLALNGGSLFGLIQLSTARPNLGYTYAPLIYVIGCAMAVVSAFAARKQSLAINETFFKFLTVATDEQRTIALNDGAKVEARLAATSTCAGCLSLFTFLAGAFVIWMSFPSTSLPVPPTP